MAKPILDDDLWMLIEPMLPPPKPRRFRYPGRKPITNRQALTGTGGLEVAARAPDGLIEAVLDPRRPFHVGVQWHPEHTQDPRLGRGLFERLVAAAAGKRNQVPFPG